MEGEVPGGARGSGARGVSMSAPKAKRRPSTPGASVVWGRGRSQKLGLSGSLRRFCASVQEIRRC